MTCGCGTFNNSGFIVNFTVIIIIIYGAAAAAVTHRISLWEVSVFLSVTTDGPRFLVRCVLEEAVIKGQEVGSNRLQP